MASNQPVSIGAAIEAELASIEAQLDGYDALVQRRTQLRAMLEIERGTVTVAADTAAPKPRQRRANRTSSTNGKVPAGEREAKALDFIKSHPDGTTNVAVAEALGVANGTASKVVASLLDSGAIRAEGERAGRKLFAGKG